MYQEENTAGGGTARSNGNPPCAPTEEDTGLCGDLPLAMAYVAKQYWRDLYEPCEALRQGTLFRSLDFPFSGVMMGDSDE
jgi:hypothetical protein